MSCPSPRRPKRSVRERGAVELERLRPGASGTPSRGSKGDAWTGHTVCWCTAESMPSPTGEIVVLRVGGDVDLATAWVLEQALANSIARGPLYLLVDLTDLEFCSARGMSVLLDTCVTAREQRFSYAISNVPAYLDHIWQTLWPDELPSLYPSVATAVAHHSRAAGSHRLTSGCWVSGRSGHHHKPVDEE